MQVAGILVWWLLITALGLVAIPIAFNVFRFLPDRGYSLAKPLGLLLVGLPVWLLGFIHFSTATVWAVAALAAAGSWWIWKKNRDDFRSVWRERKAYILLAELFFIFLYLVFLFFRMYNPDILGTEKFMDMAFMNGMSRASSFPPYDPWLSGPGFSISYYYFGYLFMTILTKLSGVPPAVAFNLALGVLFALSGLAAFGLFYNLSRKLTLGFLGWAGLFAVGNLDGFRQVLVTKTFTEFNWWTPSRVIPDTINEFPFFSYLLGDMHPHMFSVPFFLTALSLALNQMKAGAGAVWPRDAEGWGRLVLWGLVIGALGFINSWDAPTAFFVAGGALVLQQWGRRAAGEPWPWGRMAAVAGVLLGLAVIPYLPFYLNFNSQVRGIAVTTQNTSIGHYLLIFGLFTFCAMTFLAARVHGWFTALLTPVTEPATRVAVACPSCGRPLRAGKRICGHCGHQLHLETAADSGTGPLARPLADLPGGVRRLFRLLLQPVEYVRRGERKDAVLIALGGLILIAAAGLMKSPFLAILTACLLAVALLLATRLDRTETQFALLLLFTGWLLVFGAEVLHIRDTFDPPLDRMNTVFKFYYQAWFLLGIGSLAGVYWALTHSFRHRNLRLAWGSLLALLVAASLVYPIGGVRIKTNGFRNPPTLDGSAYLARSYPADREAIEWLRTHVHGHPVVLEATGGEYTDFARVSTFTGLPTVLGWGGHELQWRGHYDEPGRRIPAIDEMYRSDDLNRVQALLREYRVEYVFVGTLERQTYPASNLNKFAAFMDTVYSHPGGVTIYRRR